MVPGPTCPICQAMVRPRGENPSFPFCTARCKTIDLGKWMSEDYRIPATSSPSETGPPDGDGSNPQVDSADEPDDVQGEPVRH
jgi:endogenous inhibitor of DNA gyrase (YacG/DUF329 family)